MDEMQIEDSWEKLQEKVKEKAGKNIALSIDVVYNMVDYLSTTYENKSQGIFDPKIEEMRCAIKNSKYNIAIDLANSYYQSKEEEGDLANRVIAYSFR